MRNNVIRMGITNFCNLDCDYCFFHEVLTRDRNKQKEMTLSEVEHVLDYCRREKVRGITLHGGEPMAHTKIESIIKLIRKNGMSFQLCTNGIFDSSLLKIFSGKDTGMFLVNCNNPVYFHKASDLELAKRNIKKMRELGCDLTLGYNLFEKKPDYKFFIDLVKRFRIEKVRIDLAKPSARFKNKYVDLKDFFSSAEIISKFLKDCLNFEAWPQLDCVWPICFTSKKEFDFMREYVFTPYSICHPILDISSGLIISTCPCAVTKEDIRLSEFENLSQAEAFFTAMENSFKWRYHIIKACEDCVFWINRLCEGVCQGYKLISHHCVIKNQDVKSFLSNKSDPMRADPETLKLTSNRLSNYAAFRAGCALLYKNRLKDASTVFFAITKDGLKENEQKYMKSFLKHYLINNTLLL